MNNVKQSEKKVMTIHKLTCLRCGWSWWPRSDKNPKVCSKCKSENWDKPHKRPPRKKGGQD